jgi:GTP-binding protein
LLNIKKIDFFRSFASHKDIPDSLMAEIAFVGRSNVGKSTLINDLANKRIAMTSSTPGKTRLINFFLVNEKFYFVDLPGYGYAKISKSQKVEWSGFIEKYLETRTQLKIICFLLDIRRIPNAQDKLLGSWFKELKDVEIFYILTKADKLSANERRNQKTKIALELFVDVKQMIEYSVPKKMGKTEILKKMETTLA